MQHQHRLFARCALVTSAFAACVLVASLVKAQQSDDERARPGLEPPPAAAAPAFEKKVAADERQEEKQPAAATSPPAATSSGKFSKFREAMEKPRAAGEQAAPAERKLIVSSWAGAYGEAQKVAIIEPLQQDLGFKIDRRTRAADDRTLPDADVAELDQFALAKACQAGLLVKLDELTSDSTFSDFLVEPTGQCGVPTFAWSSIIVANGEAMKQLARARFRAPLNLANLLDAKRFPGMRALIRHPVRLLEMMLLAQGTRQAELYQRLSTREGQDSAFKALDQLSEHILWVDGPREALQALDRGKVTMAMTYSGRAFRRLIASRLRPIWDGHIIDYASWAIPATSQNREKAIRFIAAASSAESLAAQARLWPYGPMRRSALPLAKRHALLDAELDVFMPTSDLRFRQGLVLSAAFWAEHGDALQQRFDDWMAGIPLGIRAPLPRQAPSAPLPPPPTRLGQ